MEHAAKTRRAHYRAAMLAMAARIAGTVLACIGAMTALRVVSGEAARQNREVPDGEWKWAVATMLVGVVGALVAILVEDSPWLRVVGPPAVMFVHHRDYSDGKWDAWTSWDAEVDRAPTSRSPIIGVTSTAHENPDHDEWWDTPCHPTDVRDYGANPPNVRTVEGYRVKYRVGS